MDPMIRWGIRLTQWFRNPPSPRTVALVIGLVAICLLIVGVERIYGWPAWLTLGDQPPRIIR